MLHEIDIQLHHTPAKEKIKRYFGLQRLISSRVPILSTAFMLYFYLLNQIADMDGTIEHGRLHMDVQVSKRRYEEDRV